MPSRIQIGRREFLAGAAAMGLAASAPHPGKASAAIPNTWEIGCYTRPWRAYDYRVALDAIAEAGYRYAGLMSTNTQSKLIISVATTVEEAREVGEACKQRGLTIASAYCGGIPVAESLQAGIDGMRALIRNCAAAGAANLLMGGMADISLYDAYYKAIAECCDYAAERNVGISIKPHGGLNATGTECRRTVEAVNHPNFRIWYDPGNIYFYSNGELDPVEDAATVDGLVAGMSVKDYTHPKNVRVTPGTGQVDFAKVLARLKKGGFTAGPLIVETLAPGDAKQCIEEAKKARLFLTELLEASA